MKDDSINGKMHSATHKQITGSHMQCNEYIEKCKKLQGSSFNK